MGIRLGAAVIVLLPHLAHASALPCAAHPVSENRRDIQLCQGMGETNGQQGLEQPDTQQRDLEMGDDANRQDRLEQGDQHQRGLEAPDQRQQDLDTPGANDQDDDDGGDGGDDQGN